MDAEHSAGGRPCPHAGLKLMYTCHLGGLVHACIGLVQQATASSFPVPHTLPSVPCVLKTPCPCVLNYCMSLSSLCVC